MKLQAFRSGVIGLAVLLQVAGGVSAPAQAPGERGQPPSSVTDKEAQKRTIVDIRSTGTALLSWLLDQVSATAAGQSQTEETTVGHLQDYPPVSLADLEKILVPEYLQDIPKTDGWGHPYEYYLNLEDPLARQAMAIRSPGRDGKFAADDYGVSAFTPNDFDQDIVWIDGFFARWPQAPPFKP